jgi:hypothetical protein
MPPSDKGHVDKPTLLIASILLASVLVLGAGYVAGNRILLYVGLLGVLSGVATGVQRLVVQGRSWRTKQ